MLNKGATIYLTKDVLCVIQVWLEIKFHSNSIADFSGFEYINRILGHFYEI